nr:GNAT family N-acetyltransferase [Priestia flexa]
MAVNCKKPFQSFQQALQHLFILIPVLDNFKHYFLDKDYNGKGYMTQAAKLFVTYAFTELNLHRIQAEVQPHNVGSIRVLEKAGFLQEGLATKNLKIRGEWKDHQVLAIINPAD